MLCITRPAQRFTRGQSRCDLFAFSAIGAWLDNDVAGVAHCAAVIAPFGDHAHVSADYARLRWAPAVLAGIAERSVGLRRVARPGFPASRTRGDRRLIATAAYAAFAAGQTDNEGSAAALCALLEQCRFVAPARQAQDFVLRVAAATGGRPSAPLTRAFPHLLVAALAAALLVPLEQQGPISLAERGISERQGDRHRRR